VESVGLLVDWVDRLDRVSDSSLRFEVLYEIFVFKVKLHILLLYDLLAYGKL
jgi:hypothetical protein